MRTDLTTAMLDSVARALEYPTEHTARAAGLAALDLSDVEPRACAAFGELAAWLEGTALWEQEELYTRLFDLKPTCTLHIGYHVYGEAYQRGELLAGLVGELRGAGIDPGTELPDFLPTLLRLWTRIEHDDDAQLFHDRILAAGIAVIAKELRRVDHPWAAAVCALEHLFPQPAEAVEETTQAQRNWEALQCSTR